MSEKEKGQGIQDGKRRWEKWERLRRKGVDTMDKEKGSEGK
jgi:hypothetical protein